MNQTTFQPAEIYDSNGNIIQQGAFGINTPFASSTGDGVYDYIVNNLYALKDMIAAGYIAVATLPASGQTNKYYVITEGANAGKCYIWTGSAWQELTTQINGKSAYEIAVEHGFIGTEQQWLDSFTADAIAAANRAEAAMETIETGLETLEGIDARFTNIEDHAEMTDSNVEATKKRISNVEKLLQGNLYDYQTDETVAYEKTVPAGAMPYAGIEQIGGKTVVWNQMVDSGTTSVATISGHKYYTLIDGTASIITSSGSVISIVDDSADMVCDLTLMFGSGNEPSTTADFTAIFGATHYSYNAGTLLSAGVTEVVSYANLFANEVLEQGAITTGGNVTPAINRVRTKNFIQVEPNTRYEATTTSQGINVLGVYYYSDLTTFVGRDVPESKDYIFTTSSTTNYLKITYSKTDNSNVVPSDVSPVLVHKIATYPIPTAIRNLEGYGWSAGTAYNYIDYERKVFVKCVDKIVLDGTQGIQTANWQTGTSSTAWIYRYDVTNHKPATENYIVGNIVADKVVSKSWNNVSGTTTTETCIGIRMGTACGIAVRSTDTSLTTQSAINAYLSANPITAYYELAEPIETDISAYLSDDNLIEVETGGTITMYSDANGDDDAYHIPVPSTIEYMIDLNVATGGGTENEP